MAWFQSFFDRLLGRKRKPPSIIFNTGTLLLVVGDFTL